MLILLVMHVNDNATYANRPNYDNINHAYNVICVCTQKKTVGLVTFENSKELKKQTKTKKQKHGLSWPNQQQKIILIWNSKH